MAQNPQFLTLFTCKCASRQNAVRIFGISTSKSASDVWCFVYFDLDMCLVPQRRAPLAPQLLKVPGSRQFLTLFIWKCGSCHDGVHFYDLATSKSGPSMWCFVHFDLESCFTPQPRALFRTKVVQRWCVLTLFTSKRALRHKDVNFQNEPVSF